MGSAFVSVLALIGFIWFIAMMIGIVSHAPSKSDRSFKARVVRICKALWLLSPP